MLLAISLAAAIASCPIESARYTLRGAPQVTARFFTVSPTPDWPSGLALRVHVAASGRSYWFLPWQGGTDHRTNLAWVQESSTTILIGPRRDIEILTTDPSYNLQAEVPNARGSAPTHMLLPDLTNLAWHATTDEPRDTLPRAFFDLTGCRAPDPDEARRRIEFPAVP
ncbi:hypothetical protein [Sphingomonas sp. RS2018]